MHAQAARARAHRFTAQWARDFVNIMQPAADGREHQRHTVPPGKRPFARGHAQAQPGTLGLMLANAPGTQGQTSVIVHRAHKGLHLCYEYIVFGPSSSLSHSSPLIVRAALHAQRGKNLMWRRQDVLTAEGSATPQRLRTPAIGLMAAYGSRGRAPTVKNYAFPSDLGAKSLECDDYA